MYTLIAAILINSSTPYQQDIHEEYSSREQCESRANFIIKNDEYTGNNVLYSTCTEQAGLDLSPKDSSRSGKQTKYFRLNRITITAFKSKFLDSDISGKLELRATGKKIVLGLNFSF